MKISLRITDMGTIVITNVSAKGRLQYKELKGECNRIWNKGIKKQPVTVEEMKLYIVWNLLTTSDPLRGNKEAERIWLEVWNLLGRPYAKDIKAIETYRSRKKESAKSKVKMQSANPADAEKGAK